MLPASIQDCLDRLPELPIDQQREILALVDKLDVIRERDAAKDSFISFVKKVWPGFIEGYHHKIMAGAFERVAKGELKRLIINMAPRHTKSEFASHLFPAWFLGHHPQKYVILASNTADLAVDVGRKVRDTIGDTAYQKVFPNVAVHADAAAAGKWKTTDKGEYFALGTGGTMTGRGGDLIIIDDPHSEQEAKQAETKPEISWNIGGSVMQEFKMFKQNGSLTVDFYHTRFENQLIVDREENINAIKFTNLEGKSYSNSLQVELAINPLKTLELRFAYKYLDVKAEYNGVMQQQVLVPEHRGLFNIGYKTRNKRWEYDLTTSIFGESRLPQVNLPSGELTTKNRSLAYPLINAQITHVYRKFDFYVGGENILNYKQPDAIIDAENPFSSTFNATRIWGPIVGANVYAGVRFTIERDNEE